MPVIVQTPRGGAVEQQLRRDPPGGDVVVEALPEASDVGVVVMSVLSPEALARERAELRRSIDQASPGTEPLVVVIEAAEELREEELQAVLEAAEHTSRNIIVRIESDVSS
jgi:hypothetical protein